MFYILWFSLVAFQGFSISADSGVPELLKDAQIVERLGERVSLDTLEFKNEAGEQVHLGDYFRKGRPVILTPVYFNCPNLCNFLLNGLNDALRDFEWVAGREFEIVSYSINPNEGPELAAAKKKSYIEDLGRPEYAAGWHFLTGEEVTIRKLSNEVGFGYRLDPETKEYMHAAGLFVLTPDGVVSRTLLGIQFSPRDLKLALLEASEGEVGDWVDQVMLFCFHYDPESRGYSLVVFRVVQLGSLLMILLMGVFLAIFWTRQKRLGMAERPKHVK